MTRTYLSRYNMNLALAVLFITGICASLYKIYTLPSELRLVDGYQRVFIPVYLLSGATFFIGILSLVVALRYKETLTVFREKIVDHTVTQKDTAVNDKTSINLEPVKQALSSLDKSALSSALQVVCKQLNAGQGALYLAAEHAGTRSVVLSAGYAIQINENKVLKYDFGEGLPGQVAASGNTLFIDEVPDGYIKIFSGLGSSSPRYLLFIPLIAAEKTVGVLEIATFHRPTDDEQKFAHEASQIIAEKVLSIG